ncbi:MAG: TetR/AcrR family transcriptional regulator [Bacteroidales bacterium]
MVNKITDDKNTEELILLAAEHEFMTYGYNGAKTVRIASSAGVTHAMLHYYFRTKENLFNKVFEEKQKLVAKSMEVFFLNPDLPFLERIKAVIEAHFDFVANNQALPRFVINELISNPEKLSLFKDQISEFVGTLVALIQKEADEAAKQGIIRRVNVTDILIDVASLNIFPFVAFPLLQIIKGDCLIDREEFIATRRKESVEVIMQRLKP